jgi:hypothetical protein
MSNSDTAYRMYEMPDLATTISFAEFSFLKTILQQVTPDTAEKLLASTALRNGEPEVEKTGAHKETCMIARPDTEPEFLY